MKSESFATISPDKLKPNPDNFFREVEGEDYKDIKDSIEDLKIIQPIIVDEDMVILAGSTRQRVAKDLSMEEVPIIVKKGLSKEEKMKILIHSNTKVRRLSNREIGEAARREMAITNSLRKASKGLSMSPSQVRTYFNYDKLIPEFKALIDDREMPLELANSIVGLDEKEQKEFYQMLREFGDAARYKEGAKQYLTKVERLKSEVENYKAEKDRLKEELDVKESLLEDLRKREKAREEDSKKEYEEKFTKVAKQKLELEGEVVKLRDTLEKVEGKLQKLEKDKKVIKVNFEKKLGLEVEFNAALTAFNKYIKPLDFTKVGNDRLLKLEEEVGIWHRKLRKYLGRDESKEVKAG